MKKVCSISRGGGVAAACWCQAFCEPEGKLDKLWRGTRYRERGSQRVMGEGWGRGRAERRGPGGLKGC